MDLFLSWDVIWGKNDPRVAALADDAEMLRRQSQSIEAARRVWESYFLRALGAPIAFDGAAGRGQVPSDGIEELDKVRKQVEELLGHADLGVGVGLKISEADLALKLAMKRGGTVIFYTDEVPKALEEKKEDPFEGLGKIEGKRKLLIEDQSGDEPDRTFPPTKPPTPNLSPFFAKIRDDNAARKTRIKELAGSTTGSSWINKHGDGVVVGMDPHDRSQWRATVVASDGQPKYHFAAPDHANALERAWDLGVDLSKEPRTSFKLAKADGPSGPPMPQPQKIAENSVAAGGGFTGASQPGGAAGAEAPAAEASEHSQGEAMASMADDAPGAPETTTAGADFQDQMQSAADQSDGQDQQMSQQTDQGRQSADLKTSVLQVLKQVRAQGQAIEQLRLLEPQVYQAITAVTQVMVAMARELIGSAPVQKSEDPVFEDLFFMRACEGGYLGRDGNVYDVTTALALSKGEKIEPDPAAPPAPEDQLTKLEYFRAKDGIRIPAADHPARREWDKRYIEKVKSTWGHLGQLRGKSVDIGQLDHFGSNRVVNQDRYNLYRRMLRAGDKIPPIVVRRNGLKYDIVDGNHRRQAALDHGAGKVDVIEISGLQKMDDLPLQPDVVKSASKDECIHFYGTGGNKCLKCKRLKGGDLEKGKLPLPENAPKHTQREWPVGTVKDSSPGGTREVGKVKVQHPDTGKTGWVEVRAGQVMSNDGHAISSRNPGGK